HADDGAKMPAGFAIPGRVAEQLFIEFGGPFPGLTLSARDYQVRIEARLGHKKGWRKMLTFTLRAGQISFPEQYIAYSNSPFDLTDAIKAKAETAFAEVMRKVQQSANGGGG